MNELMGLEKDVALAPLTTFKIGGKARYFFLAKTKKDIQEALRYATEERLPVFVLGGGSNLLISDQGFSGLVIQMGNKVYEAKENKVYVEAGVMMSDLVKVTTDLGFKGLEWAGGLPGTVGGAIRGNAGAFGGEIKDSVVSVECIDEKGDAKILSNAECNFSYRSSIFKQRNWIVISAVLEFSHGNAQDLIKIAELRIAYRKERHPLELPNAGSVFKNCDLATFPKEFSEFVKPAVKIDPFPVVPTAFLIANANLKGTRCGNAQVSEKHPNFIVNMGGATAEDVLQLIEKVKKAIKEKFFVDLETEIQYLE